MLEGGAIIASIIGRLFYALNDKDLIGIFGLNLCLDLFITKIIKKGDIHGQQY